MLALLLVLAQSPSPVTVQLNHDRYSAGDHSRVYVQSAQDGYLVVLHADPDGRIRVLFPIDPSDDDFIRGGKRFEVRGRADRDAFQIESDDGSGTVLAAIAKDPLTYDGFVRNDHWDFRALGGPSTTVKDDPLAQLLDIVQRMTGDSAGRFAYDAATYVVNSRRVAARDGYGWDYPYHFGVGFYNPSCYDPFWGWGWGWRWGWANCYGGFGYPSGAGIRIGFGYRFGGWRYPAYRPLSPFVFRAEPRIRYEPVPTRTRTGFVDPTPVRTRGLEPRVFSRPQQRVQPAPRSFGGGSRP